MLFFNDKGANVQQNQATIANVIQFEGVGIHSGLPSRLEIRPAPANHGIVFVHPLKNGKSKRILASAQHSHGSDLCTILGEGKWRVETIEHLMAAICGCGLDNLEINVSHHEMPILDGSAEAFVQAFIKSGITSQTAPRRYLRITKPLRLEHTLAWAEFLPVNLSYPEKPVCHFDISIDFATPLIGQQHMVFDLSTDFFAREIAPARTFGFFQEAEILRARGLARGASLENCLVIGEEGQLLNPQGLRFQDEFVRHKALDAIGDTMLLGLPFIGIFRSHRPSHRLNGEIVKALLAAPAHFEIISLK